MAEAATADEERSANLRFDGPLGSPEPDRPNFRSSARLQTREASSAAPPRESFQRQTSPLQIQIDNMELDQMDGLEISFPAIPSNEVIEAVEPQEPVIIAGGNPVLVEEEDPGNERVFAEAAFVPQPPIGMGRLNLHLARIPAAMVRQQFCEAERLIRISDPETLNEGRGAETPLNLALLGRDDRAYLDTRGKMRNLFIAKLLLERGANVNFRAHLPLYEADAESPLEFLLALYLRALKASKSVNLDPRTLQELTCTVGLDKEMDLTLDQMVDHTKRLLFLCLGMRIPSSFF